MPWGEPPILKRSRVHIKKRLPIIEEALVLLGSLEVGEHLGPQLCFFFRQIFSKFQPEKYDFDMG